MLKINNKEYKVLSSKMKYIHATNNNKKCYSLLISIDFEFNDAKGYISFYIDSFNNNDFKNIENKEYNELPIDLDSKIAMIEIFDTQNFIDCIESNVIVKFGNISDDQIEMNLNINDKLIKLEYHGMLDIK